MKKLLAIVPLFVIVGFIAGRLSHQLPNVSAQVKPPPCAEENGDGNLDYSTARSPWQHCT